MDSQSKIELRDYQLRAMLELREAYQAGATGAILCLPTGAGKTATVAALIASAATFGATTAFCAHRGELLEQARAAIEAAGVPVIARSAARAVTADSPFAARVQSVVAALNSARAGAPAPTLLILDEGHRAAAATYSELLRLWPSAWPISLTATPKRTDGRGLGHAASALVMGPSPGELIEAGYLVPPVYFADPRAADDIAVVGGVVQTYQRIAGDRLGVVFASSVEHSRALALAFTRAGLPAGHIDGKTAKAERADLLARHRVGRLRVICNYDLLVEGWDCPPCSAVSLARPFGSAIQYRQAVGRVLRLSPGKTDGFIFDHGGNVARHGLIEDAVDVAGALDSAGRRKGRAVQGVTTCLACYAVIAAQPRPEKCPRCAADLPRLIRTGPELRLGELEALNGQRPARAEPETDWKLWRQIDAERARKGHRPSWTWLQYKLRKACATWRE